MKQIVVVADMKIGHNGDQLVTHALGSCLGVTVHDPKLCVGGLLHAMLPLSKINKQKAQANPYMFVDTGVPELFKELYNLGGHKKNLVVKVFGCASPLGGNEMFKIGERNYTVFKKLLDKNHISIASEDTGGTFSRTVYFDVSSGDVTTICSGKKRLL